MKSVFVAVPLTLSYVYNECEDTDRSTRVALTCCLSKGTIDVYIDEDGNPNFRLVAASMSKMDSRADRSKNNPSLMRQTHLADRNM